MLDISDDVKGITRLNSQSNINKVPLKENYVYIKAKENAKGNFIINPSYSQSDYKLNKNTSNSYRTTWIAIREKNIFKDFRWTEIAEDKILLSEEDKDYISFGEDWVYFAVTFRKPDRTILDIMMPNIEGISVLEKIREFEIIPHMLLLTAKRAIG